jgi:ApaG protein
MKSEVEGEGVVGEQPILAPAQSYQYVSGCNLITDMGKMHGIYLLEREIDGKLFNVKIPEFLMIVPYKLN